ncbi:MAG: hypothetical protein MUP76_09605, partial [Acidimicrobiia bacterium]|nr:hypothetical protein [Acidimicrobiia bacterium]
MTVAVEILNETHLDDASRLVVEGAARSGFAFIDAGLGDAVRYALSQMDSGAGLVALRKGRVAGFLAGFSTTLFNGLPGVFVPDWGHATDGDAAVYGSLYRTASERWVAEGMLTHAISLFAGDRAGLEWWSGVGFGRHLVDGVSAVPTGAPARLHEGMRRADPADLEAALAMEEATASHLRAAPVFIAHRPAGPEALRARLGDPQRPVFLAETAGRVVGWVTAKPSGETPLAIRRHAPVAIDGA